MTNLLAWMYNPTRRWNIERRDGDLFICTGYHEKSDACHFEPATAEQIAELGEHRPEALDIK